ncbi:hypothetical protein [Flammeovirga agarivorans]|uniref:Uncharacterized protein n=1 Tax=Flammeovirga agarivorans TaxID=2726742 RepID=A0A7X8SNL0_9BACT|nr:hypothetical protein [Flammeovirga agarivorans]NLR93525.1 hypothetical protein [Flammeovirga agarivorans]
MNISKLHHFVLITLSVSYSAYVSGAFLAQHVNLWIAYLGSSTLSLLAHAYLVEGMTALKRKRLSPSLFVAIVLGGVIVSSDFLGIHVQANEKINSKFDQEISVLEKSLLDAQNMLLENSSKKNSWKSHSNASRIEKQIVKLEEQLSTKVNEKAAEMKAISGQTNHLQGLTIALFLLSALASWSTLEGSTMKTYPQTSNVSQSNYFQPEFKERVPLNEINLNTPTQESNIGFSFSKPQATQNGNYLERYPLLVRDIELDHLSISKLSEKHNVSTTTVKRVKAMVKIIAA